MSLAGNSFKPETVVNSAVDKFGIPNCGRDQVLLVLLGTSLNPHLDI